MMVGGSAPAAGRRGVAAALAAACVMGAGRVARDRAASRAEAAACADPDAWRSLPPTPALPRPDSSGLLPVGNARIFVASYGAGEPVLLLHGGLANSDYWGHVIPALARRFGVRVMDTRGHGRSSLGSGTLSYSVFASDVLAVLDRLGIGRTAVVGWSDGGITGLALALARPDRVSHLFTLGANANRAGLRADPQTSPTVRAFQQRCAAEYQALSPNPAEYGRLRQELRRMWRTEPNYTPAQLGGIKRPTMIAAGEHDEFITEAHTRALAAAIPSARLVIQPCVSHFALLQDPARLVSEIMPFLES